MSTKKIKANSRSFLVNFFTLIETKRNKKLQFLHLCRNNPFQDLLGVAGLAAAVKDAQDVVPGVGEDGAADGRAGDDGGPALLGADAAEGEVGVFRSVIRAEVADHLPHRIKLADKNLSNDRWIDKRRPYRFEARCRAPSPVDDSGSQGNRQRNHLAGRA